MTVTINHTWYTNFGNGSTTGYYAVAKWTAGATVVAGQLIRQNTTPTTGNERVFVCIIAGTSATPTEPTWVVTKGAKTVDGTATWMECTGLPAVNSDASNTPLSSQNRSGAQVLGNVIQNNAGTYYFICTTAGTTGASEPTYVTTAGSTTTDSGCTWTCIGPVGSFGAWAAPMARIQNITAGWVISGDIVYISAAHQETAGGSTNVSSTGTSLPFCIYCVAQACNFPPQPSDFTTGASVTSSPGSGIGFTANADINGLSISVGTGNNTLNLGSGTSAKIRLFNCVLNTVGSSTAQIQIGSGVVEWYNVRYTTAANQGLNLTGGVFIWKDTPAFNPGGVTAGLFSGASGSVASTVFIEGVDLSSTGSTSIVAPGTPPHRLVLSGCKLPSTWTPTTNVIGYGGGQIDYINCDAGGAVYRHERWLYEGSQITDTVVVKTSGASDGAVALAWRINVSATATWQRPFECMPITVWWTSTTGPTGTVTLSGLYNGAALPFNDGIWIDCRYSGTSGSTLLTNNTKTKATIVSSHTQYGASTAAWDSIAVTRLNSTSYSLGNLFRLATNPGQLFICTTAGTSASGQPGAYASVADGSLVTDGAAVFRALVRFDMTLTLSPSPQVAGYIRCYVRAALASSTFWIDPLITLS